MATGRDWPDPAKPGVPLNPDREGPHLVIDTRGLRRWAWWTPASDKLGGTWNAQGVTGESGQDWIYIGPAKAPDDKPL
jgi:hypothetical protein